MASQFERVPSIMVEKAWHGRGATGTSWVSIDQKSESSSQKQSHISPKFHFLRAYTCHIGPLSQRFHNLQKTAMQNRDQVFKFISLRGSFHGQFLTSDWRGGSVNRKLA